LDISNVGLAGQLKSSWFARRSIEGLDVSRNALIDLRKEQFKFFPKLRYLNASFNEIKLLEPGTFLESKKIEVISLSNNHLVSVNFDNLPSLQGLYLRSNNIINVHGAFGNLPKLEILNVAENNIAIVGDRNFQNLESLKYLNLSNNKLNHIGGYWFFGCDKTKLIEIDLSFNNIERVDQISFK
jgi:Leucine-rich repeat (LRR) protein